MLSELTRREGGKVLAGNLFCLNLDLMVIMTHNKQILTKISKEVFKNAVMGWMFGPMVKTLLGICAPLIEVFGSKSYFLFFLTAKVHVRRIKIQIESQTPGFVMAQPQLL